MTGLGLDNTLDVQIREGLPEEDINIYKPL